MVNCETVYLAAAGVGITIMIVGGAILATIFIVLIITAIVLHCTMLAAASFQASTTP